MGDGSFLRLDGDSSLVIGSADRRSFQFHLNEGRAYINFRGLEDGSIKIETPNASVRTDDGSSFGVDLLRPGYFRLDMLKQCGITIH